MKLIKFRIKDYKSIQDSGWCWLASDLTILAGKNESGKSAVLEALHDFDKNKSIPADAVPLTDDDSKPEIEMCFNVETQMVDEIAQRTNMELNQDVRNYLSEHNVTIIKYDFSSYRLDDNFRIFLNEKEFEACRQKIDETVENLSKIEQLSEVAKPDIEGEDTQAVVEAAMQYKHNLDMAARHIQKKEIQEQLIHEGEKLYVETSKIREENPSNKFLEQVKQYIPDFIFFSELQLLPFGISFEHAKSHNAVQDFAKISGLDLDRATNAVSEPLRLRNMLSTKSAKISGDFADYWKESELGLVVESTGGNLCFGVKESENHLLFKPEQRSKGLQWFLSFFLRLNSEQIKGKIVLIDEPGLYLHSKAQKDMLELLEKLSENSQIIFSTHSPYLIDSQQLGRVRLVLKNKENGTQIENKIHKRADKGTLTPIATAIGLDLTNCFSIAGKKNVLLEGISDYYYFQALLHYTKKNNWDLIPCTGAQTIPQLASLLIGWDLEFLSVLDNDREGRKVSSLLKKELCLEERIVFVSDYEDFSIEDLFTHDDFNKFVLGERRNETIETTKNSEFLKTNNLDKTLLAKKFFEKVKNGNQKINLSSDTVNNFEQVFEKINAIFREN